MGHKEPRTDAAAEIVDTDATDNRSVDEQRADAQTPSKTDTAAVPADVDSPSDANTQTDPEKDADGPTEPSTPESEPAAIEAINQRLSRLEALFETQIARNQNQKQMFDVIHREMKGYKENALLEAIHKPIIHNLIQLYDRFTLIESQLNRISEPFETRLKAELPQFRANLENLRFELEEVLYRMDVTPYEAPPKKLDRTLHKTVNTRETDDPDKDQEVAETHKTGFYWGEKVFRPEEITIFRYTPRSFETEETGGENLTNEKGDETDG